MITENFLVKLKTEINLKDLVAEYVEVYPAGYNIWRSRCPHPDHNDSTPSFTIFLNKDKTWSWCCMGCHSGKKGEKYKNYGTDCIAFVQWMSDFKGSKHKIQWREAVQLLAKKADIPMEQEKYEAEYFKNAIRAKAFKQNMFPFVREYLYERGLDDTDIEEWCIGFNTFKERYSATPVPRIVFPLFNKYGQVLGSSRRKLVSDTRDDIPKYWNSPTSEWFHKRNYFYGIQKYDPDFNEIRITEGVMDVILAFKFGAKNVMAPLGTSFTEEHALFLKQQRKTPVFCLDSDAAGQKAIKKCVMMMADMGVYAKVLILPDGMDMADLANELKEGLEEYIVSHSMLYWQYILRDLSTQFDSELAELRLKVLSPVKEAANSIKSDDENILFKNYVKERFGISL